MPSVEKIGVKCEFCRKLFYKDKRHVNENLKLGHNFFCSKICEGKFRTKKIALTCERLTCQKKFFRTPKDVSAHNYCSRSCAVVINNTKYPKWPEKKCKNKLCGKMYRRAGSSYCSVTCGKIGRFKYLKPEIINILKSFYQRNKRTPSKRELKDVSDKCANVFGSWNNAIVAAGLPPNRSHDNRMYKRSKTKAIDGHICDSISEALIDNWLTRNKILHQRDTHYPEANYKADWAIETGKVLIEYFGLAKDSPRYDRIVRQKKHLCRKNGVRLIEIYPNDLYPQIKLNQKLGIFLNSHS